MQLHTGNKQPSATKGKMVFYKTRDIMDLKGKVIAEGFWHHKAPADEINWQTMGIGCATIGAVECYVVA